MYVLIGFVVLLVVVVAAAYNYSKRAFAKKIFDAADQIKLGIYLRLRRQYQAKHDPDTAGYLAAAVANYLLDDTPGGFAGNDFTASHPQLYHAALGELALDEESQVAVTQAARAGAIAAAATGRPAEAATGTLLRLSKMGIVPHNLPVGDPTSFIALAQQYCATSKRITGTG